MKLGGVCMPTRWIVPDGHRLEQSEAARDRLDDRLMADEV